MTSIIGLLESLKLTSETGKVRKNVVKYLFCCFLNITASLVSSKQLDSENNYYISKKAAGGKKFDPINSFQVFDFKLMTYATN